MRGGLRNPLRRPRAQRAVPSSRPRAHPPGGACGAVPFCRLQQRTWLCASMARVVHACRSRNAIGNSSTRRRSSTPGPPLLKQGRRDPRRAVEVVVSSRAPAAALSGRPSLVGTRSPEAARPDRNSRRFEHHRPTSGSACAAAVGKGAAQEDASAVARAEAWEEAKLLLRAVLGGRAKKQTAAGSAGSAGSAATASC